MALRMEKDGKILANRLITLSQHGCALCTDDYPVAVFERAGLKDGADSAADKIGFDGLCIHIKIERYKKAV